VGARRILSLVVAAAMAVGAAACGTGTDDGGDAGDEAAAPPDGGNVVVEAGVRYGTAEVGAPTPGRAPLLLDLYRPAAEATRPRPVVIVIHGGGFVGQSRADPGVARIARGLAGRGIVAASIDYRLLGRRPVPSARVRPLVDALPAGELFTAMAAAVDDTLTAADYLSDRADELGIDSRRLGVVGSSAGGVTADHVAYALDDHGVAGPEVSFAASLWAGIVVAPPAGHGNVGADQLEAGDAPLFAVHGDADTQVPVGLSDQLVARAEAEGVPVEYHRIPGGGHGYEESRFFTEPVDGRRTPYDRLLDAAGEALG
jgi:acetyl esterase/lipase